MWLYALGLPVIKSISYNTTTGILTCISIGGPVTNLTWNRSGGSYSQSKLIVDAVNATYHNLLYISGNTLSDYIGIFTCTVSNSRGSVSKSSNDYKGNNWKVLKLINIILIIINISCRTV